MEQQNQLSTTQPSNLQVAASFAESAQSTGLSFEDIRIPALYLKQGLSEGVPEGTYKMGDLFHSEDEVVIGGKDVPITFIPCYVQKFITVRRVDVTPAEYIGTIPFTKTDAYKTYEHTWTKYDGEVVECTAGNFTTVKVYGLLPDHDSFLPSSITLISAAGKDASKKFSHYFALAEASGSVGWDCAWEVGSSIEKKEINGKAVPFSTWTAKRSRKCTDDEMAEAEKWAKTIAPKALELAVYEDENTVQAKQGGHPSDTTAAKKPTEAELAQAPSIDEIPF